MKKNKVALITGITGQDGAYLAKVLLSKNYKVYGTYRRSSSVNFWRIKELGLLEHSDLNLIEYDLTDLGSTLNMIKKVMPDEVYNLAAQSFVGVSFDQPTTTAQITAIGPLNLLESIRLVDNKIKFYQASTSEMFGKVQEVPQSEKTPFYPRSPYGVAKLYAHWITINYRESYNIFATSGILFNHESPLRGKEFVTRKITSSVAKIKRGLIDHFELGNLDAKRDWGFAHEYVEGMWKMLQVNTPDTYVLATGRTETVRKFLELTFKAADIPIIYDGSGVDEKVLNAKTKKVLVSINKKYYRPSEVDLLIGDPSKAKKELNWIPRTSLEDLCKMMYNSDEVRIDKGNDF